MYGVRLTVSSHRQAIHSVHLHLYISMPVHQRRIRSLSQWSLLLFYLLTGNCAASHDASATMANVDVMSFPLQFKYISTIGHRLAIAFRCGASQYSQNIAHIHSNHEIAPLARDFVSIHSCRSLFSHNENRKCGTKKKCEKKRS